MKAESVLLRIRSSRISRIGIAVALGALLGTIKAQAQVVLAPNGCSISPSQLIGPSAVSVQVGDKLFADFLHPNPADAPSAGGIIVSALSNDFGYGIPFNGGFVAAGDITKGVVLKYSATVTDPTRLISGVHLGYNGSYVGDGSSHVTEDICIGGFGGTRIAKLDVLNPGAPDPAFNDLVTLLQPREKLFIQKDIFLIGGGPGNLNQALLSIFDQNFSEVPEPNTVVLAGASCVALLVLRRRKHPAAGQSGC